MGKRAKPQSVTTISDLATRVAALEEAICPRVAARLDKLESKVGVDANRATWGVEGSFVLSLHKMGLRLAALEKLKEDMQKQQAEPVVQGANQASCLTQKLKDAISEYERMFPNIEVRIASRHYSTRV